MKKSRDRGYQLWLDMLDRFSKQFEVYLDDKEFDDCELNKLRMVAWSTGWAAGYTSAAKGLTYCKAEERKAYEKKFEEDDDKDDDKDDDIPEPNETEGFPRTI